MSNDKHITPIKANADRLESEKAFDDWWNGRNQQWQNLNISIRFELRIAYLNGYLDGMRSMLKISPYVHPRLV